MKFDPGYTLVTVGVGLFAYVLVRTLWGKKENYLRRFGL